MTVKPFRIVTLINGRFVKRHEAKISVFDNALLYSEGLFEAFLAFDDRVVFLDEHLRRLEKGSRLLSLKIPVSRERLKDWILRTARRHPDRIKKIRLTITSGESPKWAGVQGKQQVIVTASSHEMPTRPFKLYVSDYRLDQKSLFRRIKTLSYIIHAVSLKEAHKKRCDDALLLNEKGCISEVTTANIFWVKDNRVYTPPLTSGCLEGVTRLKAIEELHKMGFKVGERNKTIANLLEADEVFITSSLKLALGVSLIVHDNRKYKFKPGPVTAELSRSLLELVRA
jgi:branched-chain amino acid aminotransferase